MSFVSAGQDGFAGDAVKLATPSRPAVGEFETHRPEPRRVDDASIGVRTVLERRCPMPACPKWWEDDRQFMWQHPDRREHRDHGCGISCAPCPQSRLDAYGGSGVIAYDLPDQSVPGRFIRPHRYKESRDASGNPVFRLKSHEFHRLPLSWNGHLAQCHRDNEPDPEQVEEFEIDACDCGNPRCPASYAGFLPGLQSEANVYYGNIWPVTRGTNTMWCNAREALFDIPKVKDEPFEIFLRSERPQLRRLATVRTGQSACTSNLAVLCWGHREKGHIDIYTPEGLRPCQGIQEQIELNGTGRVGLVYYVSDDLEPNRHRVFDFLTATRLTARFAGPSQKNPYVDAATVDAKNAALDFVDRDIRPGGANVLGLRELSSFRRFDVNNRFNFNGTLPEFRSEYNVTRYMEWPTLHAVTTFPKSYLRNRRSALLDVEYVIVSATFECDVILYRELIRKSLEVAMYQAPNVNVVKPIIRAKLVLNMGVRTRGLEAPAELRGVTATVRSDPYSWPRVDPKGSDEIVYRDAQGRLLFPPSQVEVDFDFGPFMADTAEWRALATGNVGQQSPTGICAFVGLRMRDMFVPCEQTNQDHPDACRVFDTATGLIFRVGV